MLRKLVLNEEGTRRVETRGARLCEALAYGIRYRIKDKDKKEGRRDGQLKANGACSARPLHPVYYVKHCCGIGECNDALDAHPHNRRFAVVALCG